ncbi:MAG: M67 family metallopeptidase [Deltaproteobacteria bacterium]|jgi:proteasome lid subunit RPN8/RPN11|nr:M67 family metallopeptidase [Deltaproteobacteria bacterium]
MLVTIKESEYQKILSHARGLYPLEACGLIAGVVQGDHKFIKKVYLLKNISQSRVQFSIAPQEQLAAILDMRKNGLSPLGNFHSHPDTPSRPSEEDLSFFLDPSASYLILSLAGDEPVLKSFCLGEVQEGKKSACEERLIFEE